MARMGFAVRDAGTPLPMRSVADARRRGGGRRVGGWFGSAKPGVG